MKDLRLVYKMSDDQGPEYFSSAEGVRWLASDSECREKCWKNGTTEGRIAQITDDRNQNVLYLLY